MLRWPKWNSTLVENVGVVDLIGDRREMSLTQSCQTWELEKGKLEHDYQKNQLWNFPNHQKNNPLGSDTFGWRVVSLIKDITSTPTCRWWAIEVVCLRLSFSTHFVNEGYRESWYIWLRLEMIIDSCCIKAKFKQFIVALASIGFYSLAAKVNSDKPFRSDITIMTRP